MPSIQKLRPAVVPGDVAGALVPRQREADLEPGRNPGGAHHPDEQRMEIGAVSVPGVAGEDRVATPPALAGLVVPHGGEDAVVDRPRLVRYPDPETPAVLRQILETDRVGELECPRAGGLRGSGRRGQGHGDRKRKQ